jgi:hypothetical protein
MRLFRRAAVALGCVAAAVGCTSAGPAAVGYAGTTAITSSAGCPAPAPGTSPADRKAAAQLQARVLLCDFAAPDGARQLNKAPAVLGGGLNLAGVSEDDVELDEWWLAPGMPTAVLAWERQHVHGDLKPSSWDETSSGGEPVWNYSFSPHADPSWIYSQSLSLTVIADGKDTAVEVSANVTWASARPASENVPATVGAVTISAEAGLTRKTVTITAPGKVSGLVTLINDLPLVPPDSTAILGCMQPPVIVTLEFRAAPGRAPLAVATYADPCTGITLTIAGRQQPPLGWRVISKMGFDQAVFQIADLSWSVR